MFQFSLPRCTWKGPTKTVRRLRLSCRFLVSSFMDITLNKKHHWSHWTMIFTMGFLFSKLCCNLTPRYLRVDEGQLGGGYISNIKAQYVSIYPDEWWIFGSPPAVAFVSYLAAICCLQGGAAVLHFVIHLLVLEFMVKPIGEQASRVE